MFFSVLTLLVVLKQLFVAQRQMDIMVRQDTTNRELLARRAKLRMYKDYSRPQQVIIVCRNDGNKTTQNFYWHLSVPVTVGGNEVWDGLGNQPQISVSVISHEGIEYRHYTGLFRDPLYPTRDTPVVLIVWGFRRSRTLFRDRPETVRLHPGTGVHLHPGILFEIIPEHRSESSRNRVHVPPESPIVTKDPAIPLWWSTVSEDGSDPTPDGKMQRMEN